MNINWDRESLDFAVGMYSVKEQEDTHALFFQTVALLQKHSHAVSCCLVKKEDKLTVRCLASTPGLIHDGWDNPNWFEDLIGQGKIRFEKREKGDGVPCAGVRRVAIPLVYEDFQGACLLWCPEAVALDPGFAEFLDLAWKGIREAIRLGQICEATNELRSRYTAILETIPQGVVFINDSGKSTWVNSQSADLLQISHFQNDPGVVAEAMQRLRNSAVNKTEIAETGARLFSAPGQSIRDWKWIFGDPVQKVLSVSTSPLVSGAGKGRLWVFSDVTEAHKANALLSAKLTESESRFRAAFERAAAGVALIGLNKKFIEVNQGFCEMLGYSREELLSKTYMEITHPDDLAECSSQANRVWTGEVEQFNYEKRYVHKSGREVWVMVGFSLVRTPDGHPLYAVAHILDITYRKKAEEELRISEERYRTVVETQTELVSRLRVDGTHTFANEVYCRFFGKKPGEILNHHWSPVVYPDDIARIEEELKPLSVANPVVRIINRVYDAQRRVRWMEFINRGLFDSSGALTEIQAVGRDVTDRVEAELQLKQALQRLKLATEAGGVGIWSWNFGDNSLEWDDRMIDWYGLSKEAAAKGVRYEDWRARVHPEDLQKSDKLLEETRRLKIPHELDFRVIREDGSLRHLHATSIIEYDRDGKEIRLIGINRDITPQRELEDKLRASMVAAEVANTAKGEFLANMSHEVRTPVTAMLGFTEMLLEPGITPDKSLETIQAIRRNGDYLLKILNDILNLSKIEAGKIEIEKIPYSPWKLMLEVESLVKVRSDERKIQLKTIPLNSLPSVVIMDPTRVRQVLINLAVNAVKFSEMAGRVELRVSTRAVTGAHGHQLILEIEDYGIGMSPTQLERVFEPFQQADSSTTRRFGGTGLGLSISKRLVEAMGGTITVRSTLGKGSCFTVTLPITVPANHQTLQWIIPEELIRKSGEIASSPHPKTPRKLVGRILLAEDSEDIRRVVQFLLKRLGLNPEIATNGLEAYEAARKSEFDLILMDMQMPEMDGYEATQALRREGYSKPIVALTAHALPEDREKCLRFGCTEYLSKPIGSQVLSDMLGRFLPALEENGGN